MSEETKTFGSSLFGYKPSSVNDYIEKINAEGKEKLDELEKKVGELTDENSQLSDELSHWKSATDAALEKNTAFLDEIANLQTEIEDKDNVISELKEKLSNLEASISELKSSILEKDSEAEKQRIAMEADKKKALDELSQKVIFDAKNEEAELRRRIADEAESMLIAAEEKALEMVENARSKAQAEAQRITTEAENDASRNLQKTRYLLKRQERLIDTLTQHKKEIDSFYEGLLRTFNEENKS